MITKDDIVEYFRDIQCDKCMFFGECSDLQNVHPNNKTLCEVIVDEPL